MLLGKIIDAYCKNQIKLINKMWPQMQGSWTLFQVAIYLVQWPLNGEVLAATLYIGSNQKKVNFEAPTSR